jgi:hypothetical protein
MSDVEQFRALLNLQEEIDGLVERYITMVKAIDARGDEAIVELDGEVYQLRKVDPLSQAIKLAHKHRGFLHDYRLVKLGKPVK